MGLKLLTKLWKDKNLSRKIILKINKIDFELFLRKIVPRAFKKPLLINHGKIDKVFAAKSIKSAFKFDLWGEELTKLFLNFCFEFKKDL